MKDLGAIALELLRQHGHLEADAEYDVVVGKLVRPLRTGENRWQKEAGFYTTNYSNDPLGTDQYVFLEGDPGFINLTDLNRDSQTLTHIGASFDVYGEPNLCFAVIVKHGNVCGGAYGRDPYEVITKLVEGDPRAMFGGCLMANFTIDEKCADILRNYRNGGMKRIFAGIIAPEITVEACDMLRPRDNPCFFAVNPALAQLGRGSLATEPLRVWLRNGYLKQPNYTNILDLQNPGIQKTGELTRDQEMDLLLAKSVCDTGNSNTITIAGDGKILGNAVGQQDRVSACELALKRAGDADSDVTGAMVASDSFFFKEDSPTVLKKAGLGGVFSTTRNSPLDDRIREYCETNGLISWTLPDSEARGFSFHS